MIETKIELRKLAASEGMVLTNGEAFSSVGGYIILACNDHRDNWHEITEAEYETILAEQEAKTQNMLNGDV